MGIEGAQFLCNGCEKGLIDEVKLSVHHNNVHSEKMCQFETPHPGNFKRHMSLHTAVRAVKAQKSKSPKTCEPCGKTFARKDVFDKHLKVHMKDSDQLFDCTVCEHKFTRKDKLVQHINRVHTDTQIQTKI